MADLNKVFLMGRLTFDPELRYASTGSAVTDLRMAINRSWNGRDGERKEESLFIDVTVWDRQAENCCQYLKKGSQVHVEGNLKMETWDDKTTGEKRSKIKVVADRVQFLDRRGDGSGAGSNSAADADFGPAPSHGREMPARRGPASSGSGGEPRGPSNGPGRGFGGGGASPATRRPPDEPESDDDIPF
jgi:single-strand DNA-binding protein